MPSPKISRIKTIAQAETRAVNRSAVLEYLRLAKSASRTEIARQLNFSKPTAMRIIDELTREGFVFAKGKKSGKRGRSQELLALQTDHNLVIGIDVGGSHITTALATIGGEILHRERLNVNWTTPETNFEILLKAVNSILAHPREEGRSLLGLGLGVPGILDTPNGLVKLAPSLNWVDYPLLQKLTQHIDHPIYIENDVNLAVLGEYWYGAGIGINNLINISIGTGIGAGIILDGKLHRGFRESSGEIGYILPNLECLNNQYPGFGALESLASSRGITKRAAEVLAELNALETDQPLDADFVFETARDGREWAKRVITETVDYLSLGIANVSVCFDPEMIILGGGIAASADMLIEPIKARLSGVIPHIPQIVKTKLNDNAVIMGAVVRVFQKVTDYAVVHNG